MSYQLWVGKEVDRYTVPVRGFHSVRIYGANLPIALFDLSKVERAIMIASWNWHAKNRFQIISKRFQNEQINN